MLAIPFARLPALAQEGTNESEGEASPTVTASLLVDPPVGSPGQMVRVIASISNGGAQVELPEMAISFPPQLVVNPGQLPAGTTLNLTTNQVIWAPVVDAGNLAQITFEFDVTVADLTQPVQSVQAAFTHNNITSQLQTDYWFGILPSATISVSPSTAVVGQQIQLIANVIGPGPIVQTWTLGDGRVIEATNPTIVYPATGVYSVTLQVANPLGAMQTSGIVNIAPETVANFTIADDTIAVGTAATFTNLSGGEAPLSYRWDFGDGQTSSEAHPSHVYNITGSFLVTLETENAYGTSISTGQVNVGRAPTADMVLVSPAAANAPAQFIAFGDDTVTDYQWDMGDGRQQSGAEITHVYDRSGEYDVTLAASNEYGTTAITQRITVGPGVWTISLPMIVAPGFVNGGSSAPGADAPEVNVPEGGETDLGQSEFAGPTGTPPEQLLWYVNEARRLHGLPPLAYNYELTVAAQQHTNDMAINRFTGHTGHDGSTPPERLNRYGYSGIYAGEATAWGFDNPTPVVEFWVNSPSHRGMILNPEATEIGIGYTYDPNAPNVWYWTVEFGSRPLGADAPAGNEELAMNRPNDLAMQRPEAGSIA